MLKRHIYAHHALLIRLMQFRLESKKGARKLVLKSIRNHRIFENNFRERILPVCEEHSYTNSWVDDYSAPGKLSRLDGLKTLKPSADVEISIPCI